MLRGGGESGALKLQHALGKAGTLGNGLWNDDVMHSHLEEVLARIAGVVADPEPNIVILIKLWHVCEYLSNKSGGVYMYPKKFGLGILVVLDENKQTQQPAVCSNGGHQADAAPLGNSGCGCHIEVVVAHVSAQV